MLKIYDLNEIAEEKIEFICENWLPFPRNKVSYIVGPGGLGKSLIVMQLLLRHNLQNPTEKLFAWLSEDSRGITKQRANLICKNIMKIDPTRIKNIYISDSPSIQLNYKSLMTFKKTLAKFQVIILDPLIAFFTGDENSNVDARIFMQQFTQWAEEDSKTIIFIHHSAKYSSKSRGASAFTDAVRLVYEIEKIEDDNVRRKIKIAKDNYGIRDKYKTDEFVIEVVPTQAKQKIKFVPVEGEAK